MPVGNTAAAAKTGATKNAAAKPTTGKPAAATAAKPTAAKPAAAATKPAAAAKPAAGKPAAKPTAAKPAAAAAKPAAVAKPALAAARRAKPGVKRPAKTHHNRKVFEERSGGVYVQTSRVASTVRNAVNGQLSEFGAGPKDTVVKYDAKKKVVDEKKIAETVTKTVDGKKISTVEVRAATDKEIKAASDWLTRNEAAYQKQLLKYTACTHENIRFSHDVNMYTTAACAWMLNQCIDHAARQAAGNASMITLMNLCSGDVDQLSIYPLIAHLPSFKAACADQRKKAVHRIVVEAATNAAKAEKKKYNRNSQREGTEGTMDTVKTVVEDLLGGPTPAAEQPAEDDAQEPAQDAADDAKQKYPFLSAVGNQCSAYLQHHVQSRNIQYRMAMDLKRTLSNMVEELICMISTDAVNILYHGNSKTMDRETLKSVLLNRMSSGATINREYSYKKSTETDPVAHKKEHDARKAARESGKKRANITDKNLPKRDCMRIVRKNLLPDYIQAMWDFIDRAVEIMIEEAKEKKEKKKAERNARADADADVEAGDDDVEGDDADADADDADADADDDADADADDDADVDDAAADDTAADDTAADDVTADDADADVDADVEVDDADA